MKLRAFARVVLAFLIGVFAAGAPESSLAATGIALAPGSVVQVSSAFCGLINGQWQPGRVLKNGTFLPLSSEISALSKRLKSKTLSSSTRTKLKTKQGKLKKKLKANKTLCSTISGPAPTPVPTIATPLPGAVEVAYSQTALDKRDNIGADFLYFCPANPSGTFNAVYGHDIYTVDSPICPAAIHAGLFTRATGGNVLIRIKGPQNFFYGSVRNGVQSYFYGPYNYSYQFVNIVNGAEIFSGQIPEITWSQTAQPLYTQLGQQFSLFCPSGVGQTRSIWGTDIYTYDSSICTAAVHAGRITVQNGGVVTVKIEPGLNSYVGSVRNGISSSSYGTWGGSFSFVP